jgi:simple sugar transport system permease protein
VAQALNVNALFPIGVVIAALMAWSFRNTGWGLKVRMVGDSADAARALGTSVSGVRIAATTAGGFIAGLGGASLSLYFPGSWNEALSSGQGLIAVALVIFARWHPVRCLWAALLFGGAGALGPALQSVGVTGYYYLFNAVPYVLTLAILVWTCSPRQALQGAPAELGVTR